jgi:hypothetical protein
MEKKMEDAENPLTIKIGFRPDGGLRVYSDDLPGLILSHSDADAVMRDILPAVRALCEHMGRPLPTL